MTVKTYFDLDSFQDDVVKGIRDIELDQMLSAGRSRLGGLIFGPEPGPKYQESIKKAKQREREIELIEKKAEKIVNKKNVRKVLCPALQSVSDDAYDIAKVIVPILVPLVLAGTISMPLNPMLFALLALVIARMGIAGICADHKKSTEAKGES